MLDAGKYFLEKQERSAGISEAEIIKIAIKSLGIDELSPFDPKKKIIEYLLEGEEQSPLVNMSLEAFSTETASESVAPGGGSVSAYVGALGVSLATMVANLSAHKRGWDDRWKEFSDWAEEGEKYRKELLRLVDADTDAFNGLLAAFRLPKGTEEEKAARSAAIQDATKVAIEVPMQVLKTSVASLEVIGKMAEIGNPNSTSDAGVGALCARAAAHGAYLNVKINLADIKDQSYIENTLAQAHPLINQANTEEKRIMELVLKTIDS